MRLLKPEADVVGLGVKGVSLEDSREFFYAKYGMTVLYDKSLIEEVGGKSEEILTDEEVEIAFEINEDNVLVVLAEDLTSENSHPVGYVVLTIKGWQQTINDPNCFIELVSLVTWRQVAPAE